MEYTKTHFSGLGKLERERLAIILRNTKATISVAEAANILNLSRVQMAKLLSHYAKKGWLSRICYGVYIPVPLTSSTTDVTLEDPLVIAEKLFSPCYVGGWSAAEYWGMTEQIFRTIVVFTTRKPRNRKPIIHHIQYILHTIKPKLFLASRRNGVVT
jgi:Predicted transcriptional regulator